MANGEDLTPREARPDNPRATPNGGQRPVPDPTLLTTEALQREVATLKELLTLRITALSEQQAETIERVETKIDGTTKVREEQFKRVNSQLELVESQRVEQKQDTQSAVAAALQAQKEAVREQTTASERSIAKSEAATNKQLEQLSVTFGAEATSLRRSIDELKERITDVDQKASAVVQQKIGAKDDRSGLYAGIGIIATVLVLGLTILGILIGVGGN